MVTFAHILAHCISCHPREGSHQMKAVQRRQKTCICQPTLGGVPKGKKVLLGTSEFGQLAQDSLHSPIKMWAKADLISFIGMNNTTRNLLPFLLAIGHHLLSTFGRLPVKVIDASGSQKGRLQLHFGDICLLFLDGEGGIMGMEREGMWRREIGDRGRK